nr:hypothetical protein [Burkholderiaceae bacterium]
ADYQSGATDALHNRPVVVQAFDAARAASGQAEAGWTPSATHLSTAQVQGSWSASQQQAYLNPWIALQRHVDEADDLPIPTPAELAAQAPTAAQAWLVSVMGASQAAPDVGVGWMFG